MKVTSAVSLSTQRKYNVAKALMMVRACNIVQRNLVRPLPCGRIAVRLTPQSTPYLINSKYESCNCEAGQKELLCVHLIAWLLWRAQNFENARDTVIAKREAQVALLHKERPRTEWIEELD